MSSTPALYPPSVPVTAARRDRAEQPRSVSTQDGQHHISPSTPVYRGHLAAFSPQLHSSSASPSLNTNTPAESVSTLSVHYQSSEYSEGDDPFFGINFNTLEGASPSFLDDDIFSPESTEPLPDQLGIRAASTATQHVQQAASYLPLSPDKSPSLGSPKGERRGEGAGRAVFPNLSPTSVAPGDLSTLAQQPYPVQESKQPGLQLTPKTSNSGESSDDDRAPASAIMQNQSPRVTVSQWDREDVRGFQPLNSGPHLQNSVPAFSAHRDDAGRWIHDQSTGPSGLGPSIRSAAEVPSLNELTAERKLGERNREVTDWLARSTALPPSSLHSPEQPAETPSDGDDNIPQREIPMGHETENNPVPGQTYYAENGGELTHQDVELMRQGRNWDGAPLLLSIYQPEAAPYQPQTSQAAMEKFEQMCRDNDSIVSRAATWGTRRFSLPSLVDAEVQVAGNFLKKLSLSQKTTRRPSILEGLRGLVRKPSANMGKRSRGDPDDASSLQTETSASRKDGQSKLAPPSPNPGWSRKQSVPSINTAFVDVGSKVAAIGATHARTGSVSATSITSPKSPLNLSVKPLNRFRSKSENQSPGIADLWKRSGGPPVTNLGNAKVPAPEADDDEDEEDDLLEDGDVRAEADKLIDDITPNLAGFQKHILTLNPDLKTINSYLVDRIAHHQLVRYKALLNYRVKHLQAVSAQNCPCGTMCIVMGGRANILDARGGPRSQDPLSATFHGSDGDITPLEGAINQESFPTDIPMPPTSTLPAEFECQLCFTAKKFQKPSDWTKHVHEDVQPFTCTWERCREPKMFKRKADWVRHENEGHRHLEWWTCDVEDCRHVCYRRDNFLQHLVREHKFTEPKVKTKAAIKRAGTVDPTWAKVEKCHVETTAQPQDEPCRFCGKTFPSWKKLTVHLAKHMESISLPILRLVAKKELDEYTIISPVQDPPPRPFPATFPTRREQHSFDPSPTMPQGPIPRQPSPMAYPNPAQQAQPIMYSIPPPAYTGGLYGAGFDSLSHNLPQAPMNMQPIGHSVGNSFQNLSTPAYPNLPVTSGPYMTAPTNSYISMGPETEPFPAFNMDTLGMQDPGPMAYGGGGGGGSSGSGGPGPDQQFTPQGSVSPYSHSPHQPQGGFYPQ
ncbi:Transcription factor IIIA [Madurella mycetomatis]|uniref:Transcription factor IIIA n=1 Tax=Madurella mycetomatis TaxID=100816 RepID=A0A175VUA1_9PEZI|nr:Transcription factor IIIA [Madurella mycetomatis]